VPTRFEENPQLEMNEPKIQNQTKHPEVTYCTLNLAGTKLQEELMLYNLSKNRTIY